ncbi:HPr kinase/phosphorylase [Acuticoccus kandeliae]|uniref:HPr kinase/phosphorylase n=1 Tax=Acuticoccus kandeliae TaxID=2073160 RepID=UPI000D3EAC6E|nr:HPr kinase/phosphatase C-terminal domain-containing protein [Acuticoccus kandeliae]
MTAAPPSIHATTIALGEAGLVIRGASGAGKSTLALALVADWQRRGRFAALVADDRTILTPAAGRLIARAPARIANLVEVRGIGILDADFLPAVRVSLLVDLVAPEDAPRHPESGHESTVIGGVRLPRVVLPARRTDISMQAIAALLAQDGLTGRPFAPQRPARTGPRRDRTEGGDR